MADLLTTGEIQELLKVDRTTIYRMIDDGRLRAIRMGKRWRFPKDDLERRLGEQGLHGEAGDRRAPPVSSTAALDASSDLAAILPQPCAQMAQDLFAEILGVMLVVTDMQGKPVTRTSNPSGFFLAATQHTHNGATACVQSWQELAGKSSLEPRFATSELGLLCARGLIRSGVELKGLLIAGCIAPDNWPPDADQLQTMARHLGADPAFLEANCGAVYRLDGTQRERVLRTVQRMADVFSQMAEDRSSVQGRLQAIISMASL